MMKRFFILASLAGFAIACDSPEKMAEQAEQVQTSVNPVIPEVHQGKVDFEITLNIPQKMFNKKVIATVTPVIVYEQDSTVLEPIMLQGESVKENYKVIPYEAGGSETKKYTVPYKPEMRRSEIFLRAKAKAGDKEFLLLSRKIADGMLATATLVMAKGRPIMAVEREPNNSGKYNASTDMFQRIVPGGHSADLMFTINSAQIRGKELRKEGVKSFSPAVTDAHKNERVALKGIMISGYASPDGPEDRNDKLSQQREKNATNYLQGQLRRLKLDKDIFKKQYTAEDWAGFQKLVQRSNVQDKDLILRVLSMHSDPVKREEEIKKMSAVYKSLADEILPKLRRSQLSVMVDSMGRTDDELKALAAAGDFSKMNEAEMLYAAALQSNGSDKLRIYEAFSKKYPNDWRGPNNEGITHMLRGDYDAAKQKMEAALQLNNTPIVLNNLGAVELYRMEIEPAGKHLEGAMPAAAAAVDYNRGTYFLFKGDYEKSYSTFGERAANSVNSALAAIMVKNYNQALQHLANAETQRLETKEWIAYLRAIVGSRTEKKDLVINNSRIAAQDPVVKKLLMTDVDFLKYADDPDFKAIMQ